MKLEEKVISIISDNIEYEDRIRMQDHLEYDLSVDSISMLMIINEFEDEFDIQIDEDEIREVETVSDIVERLSSLVLV